MEALIVVCLVVLAVWITNGIAMRMHQRCEHELRMAEHAAYHRARSRRKGQL